MEQDGISLVEKVIVIVLLMVYTYVGVYLWMTTDNFVKFVQAMFGIILIWEAILIPLHIKYRKKLTEYLMHVPFMFLFMVIFLLILALLVKYNVFPDTWGSSSGNKGKSKKAIKSLENIDGEISRIFTRWDVETVGEMEELFKNSKNGILSMDLDRVQFLKKQKEKL